MFFEWLRVEPFKNVFNNLAICQMADVFANHSPTFPRKKFISLATRELDSLELKQRSFQIEQALVAVLPSSWEQSADLIMSSLHPDCDANSGKEGTTAEGIQGWLIMPLAEIAGKNAVRDFSLSMELLRQLTMRFTAEFGIRHAILADVPRALAHLTRWTEDENHHVRRLVSEGSRPRLPWAMQLPAMIANPQLTLPLLQTLRDDPSEYVRKSVANHLNDVAKDHPELVLDIAQKWHHQAPIPRKKMLRHALRNLLKQGHSSALEIYEMKSPKLADVILDLHTPKVPMHGDVQFSLSVKSVSRKDQKIRLDIVIHYQKANGSLSPKTYLWKEITLPAMSLHQAERRQSFRFITTRVFHAGKHVLEIKANGKSIAMIDFLLEK